MISKIIITDKTIAVILNRFDLSIDILVG
jgi:hypothetical protein